MWHTVRNEIFVIIKEDLLMNTRPLDAVALTILIIGCINWGLVGFFDFNLIDAIFGNWVWISRVIYAVVGIAGIYAFTFFGRLASDSQGNIE